ncbi:MAG: GNAT family N-acetyltransferase [Catenulispora sp.]|nr:GNAT family N-acetyltransferase [Catenulispora sp.]
MSIEIRELDPSRPETAATLLSVFQAGYAVDAPAHPVPNQAFLNFLIGPRVKRRRLCLVAFDGGEPIGYGCQTHDYVANQNSLFGDLWVLPGRRADATPLLLDAFKAHARTLGCTKLVNGFSQFAAAGYEPVFEAAGGRKVSEERHSLLNLRAIDREQYAAWAAPAEKNAHYRIESWAAPTPEHLLSALVQANDAMRDAPTGDLEFHYPPPDVDRRREAEARLATTGERKHIIAALTGSGEVAGFHEMIIIPGFRQASVGNTAVPSKYRGHGLGLRLKAAMALHLLTAEPQIDVVETWNDADNRPMLRVNEALGYVKTENWGNWQFDL